MTLKCNWNTYNILNVTTVTVPVAQLSVVIVISVVWFSYNTDYIFKNWFSKKNT